MKKLFSLYILLICFVGSYGQINPMGSMYFQNQYLANPAMAGMDAGYHLSGALKAQWTGIDGAPLMETISLDYGSKNEKVGLGVLFYNETAGVIGRTSLKATYAYHLKLSQSNVMVDFGLSGGFSNESINWNKFLGDASDVSLTNFNERKMYFDGDFGIALRTNRITIQGALPDMKRYFARDIERTIIDRSTFFLAGSYKFLRPDKVLNTIEPKVAYRAMLNYKDIYDVGVNLKFYENNLIMSGIYHTTGSATIGAGTTYKNKLSILCQYTTNTSALSSYSNGEVEMSLRYGF